LSNDLRQEILKRQGDKAIAIIVVLLKHVRHALQADAALHEQVEADGALAALVVGAKQCVDELRAQPVPERNQRVRVLVDADIAAAVGVEAVEERAPRREEAPEAAELFKADCPGAVCVEHADHHLHGVGVEGGPVTVYERRSEFFFCEVSAPIFVDCLEEPVQCWICDIGRSR